MEHLAFAHLARMSGWTGEAWSALPNAPQVVSPQRSTVAKPVRTHAAKMLFRLATVVSPVPSSTI